PAWISAPKRCALSQSIPMTRSNWSGRHSIVCEPSRSNAAASPPRICGPTVRARRPCQPPALAASSRKFPAVKAPAPPLPIIATETLRRSAIRSAPAVKTRALAERQPALFLRRVFLGFFALDQGKDEGENGKMPHDDQRTPLSALVISDAGQVHERGTD